MIRKRNSLSAVILKFKQGRLFSDSHNPLFWTSEVNPYIWLVISGSLVVEVSGQAGLFAEP